MGPATYAIEAKIGRLTVFGGSGFHYVYSCLLMFL